MNYMMQTMTKILVLTSLRESEDRIILREKEDGNAKKSVVLLQESVKFQLKVLEAYQTDYQVKGRPCRVIQNGRHQNCWNSLGT
uniref:Uncharacterized protein n=1 Tax=Arundo donax TaxID=35708 RepID=A0A0A9F709_ARUDO